MAALTGLPEEASQQLLQVFQGLGFQGPDLNDRSTKKRRGNPGHQNGPADEHNKFLMALCHLTLRHDAELQSVRTQDTFILHLNKDKRGLLAQMMEAPPAWSKDLLDRFHQIVQGPDHQSLQAQLKTSKLLLEDGSWPIMQWDPKESQLKVSKKPPIPPKRMEAMLQELVEASCSTHTVIRFHSIQNPNGNHAEQSTVPWKLQVSLRADHCHQVLTELSHCSLWVSVGATMKPHVAQTSGLLQQIQSAVCKGHGKGKAKKKSQMEQDI